MARIHWKIEIKKWEGERDLEPTDTDREWIAEQIKEGYTEGYA